MSSETKYIQVERIWKVCYQAIIPVEPHEDAEELLKNYVWSDEVNRREELDWWGRPEIMEWMDGDDPRVQDAIDRGDIPALKEEP